MTAEVADDYKYDMTDLGIAKYHFEIGCGEEGRFAFGNGGAFLPMDKD